MGRIKCVKLECNICHKVGLAQVFLRKDGSISYARLGTTVIETGFLINHNSPISQ